ncbi:RagB/SusD family nutrient uptake outer membrane protein [Membranicola marinus]|uniref:RagB/SusD family nutrient uptake outer membrane protein n=1 Tax=Membranihabitans marinus TaxID=1227546 RepID=A0A953LCC6_9BACT|nr:RagB/SusD family nutrient uptake outer membrane protein [Membranihabitans marinus]MBY5959381.1 RagB/SusD family nutrient uptake outer membrane protein [Membranihabitans marinus]
MRLLYITLIIFILGSCEFLDKLPDDMKTGETVWTSRKETESFLYNVYAAIPTPALNLGYGFMGISDEIDFTWNVYPSYNINLGNWNSNSNFQNHWGRYYKAIRASFVFENNVDRNPELSEELIAQYKAEVKFLRGYYYWQLIQQYGPVPLITEERPVSADWDLFRAPFDTVVEYIIEMMEEAQKDLPVRWQNTDRTWLGKPDQMTCKAIIAAALTTAASPQWNGNSEYNGFTNSDGTALASTSYDPGKWQRAMEANKAVIDLAESGQVDVKLYRNNENGKGTEFSAFKSVRQVHLDGWNPEIIWGKSNYNPTGWSVHASPGPNNLGGIAPTQRIVDAFMMENGKWITDSESGYVEEGFAAEGGANYIPDGLNPSSDRVDIIEAIRNEDAWGHWPGEWNMYANREPRFYASVLYNKRIIPQVPRDIAKRDYYSSPGQKNGYGRVEFYYGGSSRQSGSYTFFPRTGYLVLKNVSFQSNMRDRNIADANRPLILIRYAKVLLDYIECLNEVDPNHPDIEKYWNDIRDRAGIPGIYDAYPEIKGNKELQLEHILRERQVELAFEESFDRYFTMRRRLLAGTADDGDPMRKYGAGGKMWGMDINAGNPSTNDFDFTGFYERVPFETRVFDDKMYLFPIPQSEIDRNKNLVQNPGW